MNENSTVGLFESTSEGLSVKRNYASPTIKIVAFQVEAGFVDSPYKIGTPSSSRQGTQDFEQLSGNSLTGWSVDYSTSTTNP